MMGNLLLALQVDSPHWKLPDIGGEHLAEKVPEAVQYGKVAGLGVLE